MKLKYFALIFVLFVVNEKNIQIYFTETTLFFRAIQLLCPIKKSPFNVKLKCCFVETPGQNR